MNSLFAKSLVLAQACKRETCVLICILLNLAEVASASAQTDVQAIPLVDAHLHYNSSDSETLGPQAVIEILRRARVTKAVVTSSPPELALALHQQAPALIVPLLGVYHAPGDKENWHQDTELPTRVERALRDPRWRGVGELHLFAEHRHSPTFLAIVDLATEQQLPLLIHSDPAVIDRLFHHNRRAKVIWAHAGAYPYLPLLRDYLTRYPNLFLDLSVRDHRIAPDGVLDTAWEDFIVEHSERLLIGVDTFRTQRWQRYPRALSEIKAWLSQLPDDVQHQLTYQNAQRVFPD